jgi:glutathione reductase (NADPH)
MTFDYDLFIIGAGPGGLAAAKKAAEFGVRVAIVEREGIGGTCVNRGCIPKKLIVYAADFALQNQMAYSYGWSECERYFDWTRFIQEVHQHIEAIENSYIRQLQEAGIDLIRGHANFVDEHTIDIDGRKFSADKILIAVGGRPITPNLPGIEFTISSREMFHLPYLPKRLAILGGGYIGVEFSSMMSALGCEVTVINTSEKILSGFDDDVSFAVQSGLSKRGILFFNNSTAQEITYSESGLLVTIAGVTGSQTIAADSILIATGRAPNTENLGLENAGVELGEKGAIKVDEYSRTTQENIFAVGDCTDRLQLTPVARSEAIAFVNTVFRKPQKLNYDFVPSAVFARPEAASVGMTEAKAKGEFGESVKCYRSYFQPLLSQFGQQDEEAIIKLVVEGDTERILGAHMVGKNAAEIIQSLTVAIRQGITKEDLDETIGIHPTTAEEFLVFK